MQLVVKKLIVLGRIEREVRLDQTEARKKGKVRKVFKECFHAVFMLVGLRFLSERKCGRGD